MNDTERGATAEDITLLAYHHTRIAQWRMQTFGLAVTLGAIASAAAATVGGLAFDAGVGALGLTAGPIVAGLVMAIATAPAPLD